MKQPEYTEGTQALENFERLATAVFRSPKPTSGTKKKKQVKPASSRKPKRSDRD
jgi:hypothetical protein